MCERLKPVLLVDKDDLRIPVLGLFLVHRYERRDDDFVSRLYFSCGCTVERDDSASSFGGECISGESISGGDAPDVDFLEWQNSSGFH